MQFLSNGAQHNWSKLSVTAHSQALPGEYGDKSSRTLDKPDLECIDCPKRSCLS